MSRTRRDVGSSAEYFALLALSAYAEQMRRAAFGASKMPLRAMSKRDRNFCRAAYEADVRAYGKLAIRLAKEAEAMKNPERKS